MAGKDVVVTEVSQEYLDGLNKVITKAVADTAKDLAKEMRKDESVPVKTGEYRDSINVKISRKKAKSYIFEDRKKKRSPKKKIIGHHVEKHKAHWAKYNNKTKKVAPLNIADAINNYTKG